ncbi:MAG: tRNA lysidine(34) synthetase TilS [Acidobacteria bacterium]|nr:tRNA lysidine(34) synthetase TilS [Acidobacteriota bacterium]
MPRRNSKETLSARVLKTIRSFQMIRPGQRIAVACSGGPDSTALLLLLHELRDRLGCTLSVAHLNHRLRAGESDADEQFVRALAERLQLPVHVEQMDVRAHAEQARANLEETARLSRYRFFLSLIQAGSADCVALGHTADDQAETILFRLLRGAGTRGLAGIHPVVADQFVRPLLETRRQAILDWLQERRQTWRVDASNLELRYTRNRIRHQLLPSLAEFNPRIVETLADTARLARDEEVFWREYLQPVLARTLHRESGVSTEAGRVLVDIPTLAELPQAVARRILRCAIAETAQFSSPQPPDGTDRTEQTDFPGLYAAPLADFDQTQELLRLALHGQSGAVMVLPRNIGARKEFQHLILQAQGRVRQKEFRYSLQVPALVEVPILGAAFALEFVPLPQGQARYNGKGGGWLKSRLAESSLLLRNWQPGDAYQPSGHRKRKKLKELFQRDRVPFRERESWPVLVAEEQVVWARRWGADAAFAPAADSTEAILIQEAQPKGGAG